MIAGSIYTDRALAAIQPLASVFSAMLFASIGMIINPMFFWNNIGVISALVTQIIVVKFVAVSVVIRFFNYSWCETVSSFPFDSRLN